MQDYLKNTIHWLKEQKDIQVVLLTGSRARKNDFDDLSDYDLAVYGTAFNFLQNDEWLKSIGPFLVCIHDQFEFLRYTIPTRLVLFNTYYRVDFSFHPLKELDELRNNKNLLDDYAIGYQVLIDKGHLTEYLPLPTYHGFIVKTPDEKNYTNNVNEFWFEVYHVAKYLKREEYWTAKLRDVASKKWLLEMLQWNTAVQSRNEISMKKDGQKMKSWMDKNIYQQLDLCFSSLNKEESLKALVNTIMVYRNVAMEVAQKLSYRYNEELDTAISCFVNEKYRKQA